MEIPKSGLPDQESTNVLLIPLVYHCFISLSCVRRDWSCAICGGRHRRLMCVDSIFDMSMSRATCPYRWQHVEGEADISSATLLPPGGIQRGVPTECLKSVWRHVSARSREPMRVIEVWSCAGMKVQGKRENNEKTRRPAASSGTMPAYEHTGVTRPGIEPGAPRGSPIGSALSFRRNSVLTSITSIGSLLRAATHSSCIGGDSPLNSSSCWKGCLLTRPCYCYHCTLRLRFNQKRWVLESYNKGGLFATYIFLLHPMASTSLARHELLPPNSAVSWVARGRPKLEFSFRRADKTSGDPSPTTSSLQPFFHPSPHPYQHARGGGGSHERLPLEGRKPLDSLTLLHAGLITSLSSTALSDYTFSQQQIFKRGAAALARTALSRPLPQLNSTTPPLRTAAMDSPNSNGAFLLLGFTISFGFHILNVRLWMTTDKIGVKHVYTKVDFAIGLQFNRHAQDYSEPITDVQGNKGRGDRAVSSLASHLGEPGSIPGRGIVPDYAVGRRVFSGISRFPFIPVLLHTHLNHHHHRLSRPRCQEPPKSLHSLTLMPELTSWSPEQRSRNVQRLAKVFPGSCMLICLRLERLWRTNRHIWRKGNRARSQTIQDDSQLDRQTSGALRQRGQGSPLLSCHPRALAAETSTPTTIALASDVGLADIIWLGVFNGSLACLLVSGRNAFSFPWAARWLLAPAPRMYSSEQTPAYLATLHHTPLAYPLTAARDSPLAGLPDDKLLPRALIGRRHSRMLLDYGATDWLRKSCGAAVAKRLDCSPPNKADQVQSPAGSLPDFRKWESCQEMPRVGGFSRGFLVSPVPCILALLHSHLISPASALKTSLQEVYHKLHLLRTELVADYPRATTPLLSEKWRGNRPPPLLHPTVSSIFHVLGACAEDSQSFTEVFNNDCNKSSYRKWGPAGGCQFSISNTRHDTSWRVKRNAKRSQSPVVERAALPRGKTYVSNIDKNVRSEIGMERWQNEDGGENGSLQRKLPHDGIVRARIYRPLGTRTKQRNPEKCTVQGYDYDGNTARLARRSDEALDMRVRLMSPVSLPRFLTLDVRVPTGLHPTLKHT
ncbi:hypothetical protein PR048_030332 [Dryococelus australis]|uniref:Uncharacterized protein n=1 Tax=Dryococelus australis TaxID=614101 RepID=A0ABQ9G8Q8_9NEOP|nr:hypothetical protein PR048_030332 [Dryococelus australis]